jgi:hypothetical protein
MKALDDALVEFLAAYGQPQRWQTIRDVLEGGGYKNFDITDADRLVEEGRIKKVVDGVDTNGDPLQHYAPLEFSG